jgi:hypothetical protein
MKDVLYFAGDASSKNSPEASTIRGKGVQPVTIGHANATVPVLSVSKIG